MGYGNLAYKDYAYKEIPQITKQKTTKSTQEQTKKKSKPAYLVYISWILAIAASAAFMVSTFVNVYDTRREVNILAAQLAEEETLTSQKAFELEKSVSLVEIEKEATTRLGMQRPESYQYVYVNVKQADKIEKIASGEEGFIKSVKGALSNFFGNIVNAFSIE